MASNEIKNALDNIHTNKIHKYGKIRGLQITKTLEDLGLLIKDTCEKNKVKLNIVANAETRNQARINKLVDEYVEILHEKMPNETKDQLFGLLIEIFPLYLLQYGKESFEQWISDDKVKRDIPKIKSIPGIEGLFSNDSINEETDKLLKEHIFNIVIIQKD